MNPNPHTLQALVGHAWARRSRWSFWGILWIFLCVVWIPVPLRAQHLIPDFCSNALKPDMNPEVCSSVLIMKKSDFKKLCHCKVIEGHLHIRNIPKGVDLFDLSFPNLVEIKDFLLVFRVGAELPLGSLFPGLTIIRGDDLLSEFALVLYEVDRVTHPDLPSLVAIDRGHVFVKTTHCLGISDPWAHAVRENSNENKITSSSSLLCDVCLDSTNVTRSVRLKTFEDCPVSCPRNCLSRSCCSELCLSGCHHGAKRGATECLGCKHFSDEGKCVLQCPEHKYKVGHSCVKRETCVSRRFYIVEGKRECLPPESNGAPPMCPPGFKIDHKSVKCVQCSKFDRCTSSCQGTKIRYVDDALALRNCTVVEGNLQVQVQGGDFVQSELEENLGNIREVTGFVSLVRMSPTSVKFLKKLVKIHGQTLTREGYALVVEDNKNLESLDAWLPEGSLSPSLEVTTGKVLFRDNPKLCYDNIVGFLDTVDLPEQRQDVSTTSNGHKQNCDEGLLKVSVKPLVDSPRSVEVRWTSSRPDVFSNVSTYYVSYKAAPNDLQTNGNGQTCDVGWTTVTHDAKNVSSDAFQRYVVSGLVPFTRYAFYVRTFSGQTRRSNFAYAVTGPHNPSSPEDVSVTWLGESSLGVVWSPPVWPNGVIDHYEVTIEFQRPFDPWFEAVDFCDPRVEMHLEEALKKSKNSENIQKFREAETLERNRRNFESNRQNLSTHDPLGLSDHGNRSSCSNEPKCNCEDSHPGPSRGGPTTPGNDEQTQISFNRFDSNDGPVIVGSPLYTLYEPSNHLGLVHASGPALSPGKITKMTRNLSQTFQGLRRGFYAVRVSACQRPIPCSLGSLPSGKKYRGNVPLKCKLCSLEPGFASLDVWEAKDPIDLVVNGSTITTKLDDSGALVVEWDAVQFWSPVLRYMVRFNSMNQFPNEVSECVAVSGSKGHRVTLRTENLKGGNTSVRIQVVSMATRGKFSSPVYFSLPDMGSRYERDTTEKIVAFLVIVLLGLCFVFAALKIHHRFVVAKFRTTDPRPRPFIAEADLVRIRPERLIGISDLEILFDKGPLGSGHFGQVFEASMTSGFVDQGQGQVPRVRVAVKTPKSESNRIEIQKLIREIQTTQDLCHPNLVASVGVVVDQEKSTLYYVMEFMEHKDLKTYLRNSKTAIPSGRLVNFALDAASGLGYLEDRNLVHRDVAARNCLLDRNYTLKIGDFGLTIPVEEFNANRLNGLLESRTLPYQWMAPESMVGQAFSPKSDVWSFGVLLWEMSTAGQTPFKDWEKSEIVRHVVHERDHLIPPKSNGSPHFSKLMLSCWQYDPNLRPRFEEILKIILMSHERGERNNHRQLSVSCSGDSVTPSNKTDGSDSGYVGGSCSWRKVTGIDDPKNDFVTHGTKNENAVVKDHADYELKNLGDHGEDQDMTKTYVIRHSEGAGTKPKRGKYWPLRYSQYLNMHRKHNGSTTPSSGLQSMKIDDSQAVPATTDTPIGQEESDYVCPEPSTSYGPKTSKMGSKSFRKSRLPPLSMEKTVNYPLDHRERPDSAQLLIEPDYLSLNPRQNHSHYINLKTNDHSSQNSPKDVSRSKRLKNSFLNGHSTNLSKVSSSNHYLRPYVDIKKSFESLKLPSNVSCPSSPFVNSFGSVTGPNNSRSISSSLSRGSNGSKGGWNPQSIGMKTWARPFESAHLLSPTTPP